MCFLCWQDAIRSCCDSYWSTSSCWFLFSRALLWLWEWLWEVQAMKMVVLETDLVFGKSCCTIVGPVSPEGIIHEMGSEKLCGWGRFTYFCRASLELLVKLGKQADILHLHNWQTAAVAPLFWDIFVHQVSVTVVQQRERKYLSRPVLFFIVLL